MTILNEWPRLPMRSGYNMATLDKIHVFQAAHEKTTSLRRSMFSFLPVPFVSLHRITASAPWLHPYVMRLESAESRKEAYNCQDYKSNNGLHRLGNHASLDHTNSENMPLTLIIEKRTLRLSRSLSLRPEPSLIVLFSWPIFFPGL